MKLQRTGSLWNRDNRNGINSNWERLESLFDVINKLLVEGQMSAEQYSQVITTLNGLIKKGEVSVSDIDKNKGKLDQTYLSDELLQQMAGDTPINAVPANGSITSVKIADNSVGNRTLMTNGVHHDNIADLAVRERHLAASSVTPIKISTDSNGINKGKIYPLKVVWRDGAPEPYDTEISNVILSAKVIGARKDKMYSIRYIANGFDGYYGISLAEWDKTPSGGIVSAGVRTLIDYKDASFNHNEPSGNIVHRTIHIPNEDLSFEIIYDRSEIKGSGLDIANTALGKGRSAIIHPENYVYRMGSESVNNTSNSKVFMEKKADRFFVYKPVSNGNYIGHEITYYEKGIVDNASSNYKLWCVRTIKEYSRSGDSFTPVRSIIDGSTPTTMDLMIKENDDMDYMGGIHHGDEINDFAMLLVDGKPIDLSATGFYEAKEVRLIQRNKLYRDTVYTGGVLEHLGTVGKEHVFNYEDGYTLHNRVTWHEGINIVQAFLGSLSMYRKDEKGNSPLWHTAINDITHTPYDLKTIGGQMPSAENLERLILTGDGVGCTIEIERLNNVPGNVSWVANFAEVNSKFYSSYVPNGYTTKVGEVWKQKTNFKFELF